MGRQEIVALDTPEYHSGELGRIAVRDRRPEVAPCCDDVLEGFLDVPRRFRFSPQHRRCAGGEALQAVRRFKGGDGRQSIGDGGSQIIELARQRARLLVIEETPAAIERSYAPVDLGGERGRTGIGGEGEAQLLSECRILVGMLDDDLGQAILSAEPGSETGPFVRA